MASKWSAGAGITAAALVLPLWLGACGAGSGLPVGSDLPAGTAASERAAGPEAPLVPVPQPQAAPPAGSPANGTSPGGPALSGPATPAPPSGHSGSPQPGAGTGAGTEAAASTEPSPAPLPSAPPPSSAAAARTVTVYYVVLDDGGNSGVRFGCNDSLVGVRRPTAGSVEPLPAAMGALLDGSTVPAGVYDSLSASTLRFLSGTFDGTTVTVYLSGTIRPGGVCDIPRVEAQLTQTAVSSMGAIRAEIYVNGVGLTEALSLK